MSASWIQKLLLPRLATTLALLMFAGAACTSLDESYHAVTEPNQVLVLGMIHSGHVDSDVYGISVIQDIVRRFQPDVILTEIPPDRLATAVSEFKATGLISEPRVSRFPEYVDAIFPLTLEMDFEIVACAGWTREMATDRSAKLKRWEQSRPEATREVDQARQRCSEELQRRGLDEDPRGIHTDAYDAIVKRGLEPYNRLFNDDLGAGGWDNINAAHYAHIAAALDAHTGEGRRYLITFGAYHKTWFQERLRRRDDIVLLDAAPYLPAP